MITDNDTLDDQSGLNNTLLNILNWVLPIDETCITLNQMSCGIETNKKIWKIKFICFLIFALGIKLSLFSESTPIFSFASSIFLTLTFTSTTILKKLSDILLNSLIKIHQNNPIIYTLFQLILAICIAVIVDKFLSNVYNYIGAGYLSLLIYRRLEKTDLCKNLNSYYKLALGIFLLLICIVNQFLIHKYCNRCVMIGMYSIIGIVYYSLSLFVLIFIYSGKKYGFSPEQITRKELKNSSNIISLLIIFSFIYQYYKPSLNDNKNQPLNNICF